MNFIVKSSVITVIFEYILRLTPFFFSEACGGEIFLRYLIVSKTGETVAMSPYIPQFSDEFSLVDVKSGSPIAVMKKNGDWSPKNVCPNFQKNWLIEFQDVMGVAPGSQHAKFVLQDSRWVTAAFLSVMGLRDESRKLDGSVAWSACKKESVAFGGLIAAIVILFIAGFLTLWIKFRWSTHATRYMFKIQEKLLPLAKHQVS